MIPNKIKKIVLLAAILGSVAAIYFGWVSYRLSRQLKNQENNLDKSSKEVVEIKRGYDKIKNDFAKLRGDYDALSLDRNNTFSRAKELLAENQRLKELKVSLEDTKENNKKEMQLLEKAKQEVLTQNLALKKQIQERQTIQKQLLKEKEQLQEAVEREKEKSGVRKLEQENLSLKSAKNNLENSLKQKDLEINKLKDSESKLKQETGLLNKQVELLNKNYAEAVRKNKEFETRVGQLPVKFAELARQNKLLVKRTANIHYNMGVFYTQQKEYTRAAAEFEKALELTPDDAYAHFNLGYIYAEYLVNRPKAIEHFRQYLRYAKKDDKDVDWVKKYILSWEAWGGQKPLE
jgi:chromosome segregation ATPase